MKKVFLCSIVSFLLLTGSAYASDFDFSGTFTYDNDVVLLNFTVGSDSTITIFSSSWGNGAGDYGYVSGGGFDPILAIWNASGAYVSEQDDGGIVGSAMSNGTAYTYGVWDSYYDVFLTAGSYTASIAQYDNFRNGNSLASGFTYDGNPNFTYDQGYGSQPYFNGVWDIGNDPRTGDWAFHILNVEEAEIHDTVPEPATFFLFGLGLLGIAGLSRKK